MNEVWGFYNSDKIVSDFDGNVHFSRFLTIFFGGRGVSTCPGVTRIWARLWNNICKNLLCFAKCFEDCERIHATVARHLMHSENLGLGYLRSKVFFLLHFTHCLGIYAPLAKVF